MTLVQSLTLYSIAASLVYLAALTIAVVILALRSGGRREDPAADRDALSASRFSIPVSLIVPLTAAADGPDAAATLAGLLGLNYPGLEVIVITEGLSKRVWESLKDEWRLEAREFFYRFSLATSPVRMMYRSARDARLLVVDKTPGTPADALNCGVSLARYRFVSVVEPGVVFDADALLRAMAAPLRDPAGVVGATIHVETTGATLQRLRSIRSLMDSRLAWRHLTGALGPLDAVVVWRREAVEHAGGFSAAAADPHLEMMVRLQTTGAPGTGGQVVRAAEIFGSRRPRPFSEHLRAVRRRQLAALQAVASMLRAGPPVCAMLGYFFMAEILTPCAQAWVAAATMAGAAAGWLSWLDVSLVVLLLAIGHALVSGAALLVRGELSDTPDAGGLRRLLLLAPLDFLACCAGIVYARTAGALAFLMSPWSRGSAGGRTANEIA
jgi:hypothetical protein